MRLLLVFISILVLAPLAAPAQSREEIVLTGGPALRFLEHGKAASHDFYWFNFVDASVIRLKELKDQAKADDLVTWLVYRPGYASRSREMEMDLLPQIEAKAKNIGANLVWFDTTEQLIAYLNKGLDRDKTKIAGFDYFGHSNKACFLFDYSNTVDTMSIAFLHVRDLKKIDSDDFSRRAACKSWGCHSGEMYSQWWKSHFDIPLIGAVGKTDFSHGGEPVPFGFDRKVDGMIFPRRRMKRFAVIPGLFFAAWLFSPGPLPAQTDGYTAPAGAAPPVAPPVRKGSPLDHLTNDPKLATPTVGYKEGNTSGATYWIAHRFVDDMGGSGWGWVKKKGDDWDDAKWVALRENPGVVVAPFRKLVSHDADNNWEYKFWGTIAPYKAYDPHLDEMVPVFVLEGYEVVGLADPLSIKTGPPDRVRHRPSGASSREGRPILTDPGVD